MTKKIHFSSLTSILTQSDKLVKSLHKETNSLEDIFIVVGLSVSGISKDISYMLLTFIIFFIVKNELISLANIVITSFGFANFNTLSKSSKIKPNELFLSHLYSSKPSSFFFHIK